MTGDEYGFHLAVTSVDTEDGADPHLADSFADWLRDDARVGAVLIVVGAQYIEITVEHAPAGLSLHEPAALAVEFLRDRQLQAGETLHVCWDRLPDMRARPGFCPPTIPTPRSA